MTTTKPTCIDNDIQKINDSLQRLRYKRNDVVAERIWDSFSQSVHANWVRLPESPARLDNVVSHMLSIKSYDAYANTQTDSATVEEIEKLMKE